MEASMSARVATVLWPLSLFEGLTGLSTEGRFNLYNGVKEGAEVYIYSSYGFYLKHKGLLTD